MSKLNIIKNLYTLSWLCLIFALSSAIIPKADIAQFEPDYFLVSFFLLFYAILICLRVNSSSSYRFYTKGAKILMIAGFSAFSLGSVLVNLAWSIPDWLVGLIMVCLLCALICLVISNDTHSYIYLYMCEHRNIVLLGVASLSLCFLGFTLWIPGMWGIYLPAIQIPGGLVDCYIGQLSLTFITISVLGVLSDKNMVIYWENIAEAKLIKPLFASYASFTTYSIFATIGAGISVLFVNHLAFAIFFTINVIVLILLTLSMVDVYFGKEDKIRKLETQLRKAASSRSSSAPPNSLPTYITPKAAATHEAIKKEFQIKSTEYPNIMLNLQHYLYRGISNHDLPFIREVCLLYGRNIDCFAHPEGQIIENLLFTSSTDPWPMIIEGLEARTAEIEQKQHNMYDFYQRVWEEDTAVWHTLLNHNRLSQLTKSQDNMHLLTRCLYHRLSILAAAIPLIDRKHFNRYTLHYHELLKNKQKVERDSLEIEFLSRPSNAHKYVRGYIDCLVPSFAKLKENNDPLISPDSLLAILARLTLILLSANKIPESQNLRFHVLVIALFPFLSQLGFSSEEISEWKNILYESSSK